METSIPNAFDNSAMPIRNNQRIIWVDMGKVIAISLVFYGHGIERFISKGFVYGISEGRIICSFTIPFFLFLSGYVYRHRETGLRDFLLQRFNRLLIPLFFFNLLSLAILLSIHASGLNIPIREAPGSIPIRLASLFILGLPVFNGPTWFLTLSFTIQMLYFIVARFTTTITGLLVSIMGFSIVGSLIIPLFQYPSFLINVLKLAWYIPTALTGIAFFQLGILARRLSFERFFDHPIKVWIGLFVALILLLSTFNLNSAAYSGHFQVIYMNYLNMGNYFLFNLTALAGTLCAICLSMLIKSGRFMQFYGNSTLLLLGINGIFCHYINPSIVQYYMNYGLELNRFQFNVIFIGIALIQLAVSYPLIKPIDRVLNYLANSVSSIGFRLRSMEA